MKKTLSTILVLLFFIHTSTIAQDTLKLNPSEIEAIFLKNNIDLIFQKLNISKSESSLIQSKYWPNPTLEISEVNLWKNQSVEEGNPIISNWGKTTQLAISIEQAILTAGKRKKSILLQELNVISEELVLRDLLRNLRRDLRNLIIEIIALQQEETIFKNQTEAIQQLTNAYNNQFQKGNISKSEFVRLKAEEISLQQSLKITRQALFEKNVELKNYLQIGNSEFLFILSEIQIPLKSYASFDLNNFYEKAIINNPELLYLKNEEKKAQVNWDFQKALKTPDLKLSINYDRNSNIMKNFIGFGVAMDLPVFDRNKGNINIARFEMEQSQLKSQKNNIDIKNNIAKVLYQFQSAQEMYELIEKDFDNDLDQLLYSHIKNFKQRNISMLEFIDFLNTYTEHKTILINTKKDINQYYEDLQFIIGEDL
ncbi:MAG TPA: TolC family protein [Edaphocola sp.]|nr:TolC family protein [Edaphocola sp.]